MGQRALKSAVSLLFLLLFFHFNLNNLTAIVGAAFRTNPVRKLWLFALRAGNKAARRYFPVCTAFSAARFRMPFFR
jgi:hypothetical protein